MSHEARRGAAGCRSHAVVAQEELRDRQADRRAREPGGAMILVTGFEPFGGHPSNPSEEIAKSVDGRVIGGLTLRAAILPVHHFHAAAARPPPPRRPRAAPTAAPLPG